MIQRDIQFLERTINLAKRGKDVFPNPRVGTLVVKSGRIIAQGWHARFGGPHAEAAAFAHVKPGTAKGATVYVSLEPCADWNGKKTPSCAKRLVQEGVRTVVIGMCDPQPNVRGRGVALLQRAGIRVIVAPQRLVFYDLNDTYLRAVAEDPESWERPFVLMKTAMSVDGKIGTPTHRSVSFSTPEDRRAVDALRATFDAIMVGGTTLRHDKPRLTVKDPRWIRKRIAEGRDPQPLRVAVVGKELIVGRDRYTLGKHRVDLKKAMAILAIRYGVRRLMLEGGGELNFAMLERGYVDELRVATAPMLLGGRIAPTLVDGNGFDPRHPIHLSLIKKEKKGAMDIAWYKIFSL